MVGLETPKGDHHWYSADILDNYILPRHSQFLATMDNIRSSQYFHFNHTRMCLM